MRPAVPLSVQLLLTFVGLLLGMTWVLMNSANTSLLSNLELEAQRTINVATKAREQTLTQLFQLRQQRAQGMLASVESLCAEPIGRGRLGWVGDCVRTMVDDFRESERAMGVTLIYGNRRLRRSGAPVPAATVPPGSLARVLPAPDGGIEYIMTAAKGQTVLTQRFDSKQVADLFDDQSSLGRTGEVFLVDQSGEFLIPARHESPGPFGRAFRRIRPALQHVGRRLGRDRLPADQDDPELQADSGPRQRLRRGADGLRRDRRPGTAHARRPADAKRLVRRRRRRSSR